MKSWLMIGGVTLLLIGLWAEITVLDALAVILLIVGIGMTWYGGGREAQ